MGAIFDDDERREIAGRARTLHERIEGVSNERAGNDPPIDPGDILDEWRATYPDAAIFEERLELEGLTETEIREEIEATSWPTDEPLPDWIDELESLIAYLETEGPAAGMPPDDREPVTFEEIVARIADYGRSRLDDDLVPVDAVAPAVEWLVERVEDLTVQPLYVEFRSFLDINAPEGVMGDADAVDDPPTAYYEAFVDAMFEVGMRNLSVEYPVLVRFLVRVVDQWVTAIVETCRRIRSDRPVLRDRFGVEGVVTSLEPLADDAHAGGRIPFWVHFESGDAIYKPRSVEGGRVFYEILDRLDDHLSTPSFDGPHYLPRDGYGWMSPVEYRDLPHEDAAERYYERAGVLLCLGYALNFSDCQLQNVIASGETPVLVDGETVFHSWTPPAEDPFESVYPALIKRSVLYTALLPFSVGNPLETGNRGIAQFLAGYGEDSSTHELAALPAPSINAKNTDLMSVGSQPRRIERHDNTPTVAGSDRPPAEYADAVVRGFREAYRTIQELDEAGEFFSEVVTPDLVEGTPNRLLYRTTAKYVSILNSMVARDPLRDGARLTLEIEELTTAFYDERIETAGHWSMYEAERRALRRRDVPRFESRADSTTVLHDGSAVDTVIDVESGYDRVRKRVESFDATDLRRQTWFIRRCYRDPRPLTSPPEPMDVTGDRLRETAHELFDDVVDAAVPVGDRREWISTGPGDRGFSLIPAGESLYYGRSGIALAAGALYAVEGDRRYRRLVEELLQPVIDDVLSGDDSFAIGGAMGVGSVVYGLSTLAELLEEDHYLELASSTAEGVTSDQLAADETFDVVRGSAGTLLGLLAHYDRSGDEAVLDRAVACGERLLSGRVEVDDQGHRAWRTEDDVPYTGFAHGSSGIAYALARLGSTVGEPRFVDAARETLDFESTLYDPDRVNWSGAWGSSRYQDRWCHGRTGMTLARMGIAAYVDAGAIWSDAEAGLAAIASADPTRMDHVCCGNLGRVETLLVGARRGLCDRSHADRLAGRCLARRERDGTLFLQGHTDSFVNPTWFNGVSGAVYTFLRLAEPDRLPSVLLFE